MPIQCTCPKCRYRYEVANELAGKTVLCPGCQTRFSVKRKPIPGKQVRDISLWANILNLKPVDFWQNMWPMTARVVYGILGVVVIAIVAFLPAGTIPHVDSVSLWDQYQSHKKAKESMRVRLAEEEKLRHAQPFIGRWKVVESKGVTSSYLTVKQDFTAFREHAGNQPGTWEVVGNEARFTWSEGVRDIMRLEEGGQLSYFGLGETTSWDSTPNFQLRAVRIQ